MLIFDTETDGFLEVLTKLNCLVIKDTETGGIARYNGPLIVEGLRRLMVAAAGGVFIIGHNAIKFDIPAIKKVYPWFDVPESQVLDTMVWGRLCYPDLIGIDQKLVLEKRLPGNLRKKHTLEAWGHRLGCHKGAFSGPWDTWTMEMEDYCVQDVEVTHALINKLQGKAFSQESIALECAVQWIIARQETAGVCFNLEAAAALYRDMVKERLRIEGELQKVFFPRYLKDGKLFTPKKDLKRLHYSEGAVLQKLKLTPFNPGSRDHIELWLRRMYGWEPEEFCDDGSAKIDETTLIGLPYPEAKVLNTYLLVQKRIGQLAEGKEAWLRHEKNGRIHGGVIGNGAVTGRATHLKPNISQVPKVKLDRSKKVLMGLEGGWGYECRGLYTASPGRVLVGADLSGIELRCLAHFMALYDQGAYVKVLLEGDVHEANRIAAGLDTRDNAKTFIYAFLYGAGNEKIGKIVGKGAKVGGKLKKQFLSGLPALDKLIKAVVKKAGTGSLKGLDGRIVPIRYAHAALNTLLQGAGALIAKQSLVIFDRKVVENGWRDKCQQVLWSHDEIQVDSEPDIAEQVGKTIVESFKEAGEHFKLRCPITGEFKIGATWAETH